MAVTSRRILFPHKFTVGSVTYLVDLPDIYETGTSNIGSSLGIDKQAANYVPGDNDVRTSISTGMLNGDLIRLVISYREAQGKTKSSRIVCPINRVSAAIGSLKGKNFDGGKVVSARSPRRRRLG